MATAPWQSPSLANWNTDASSKPKDAKSKCCWRTLRPTRVTARTTRTKSLSRLSSEVRKSTKSPSSLYLFIFFFKGKNKSDAFFTVKINTPMKILKESYKAFDLPVTDLRFMFLNHRINDDETPKILNLMEGDIIQVFLSFNGLSAEEEMYDIVDKITASDSNRDFPMLKVLDTSDRPMTLSCCPQGHIVFQIYWRPRLPSCPTCGIKLLPILQSASILENVLHQCKFSYNGCAVKMRPRFLEVHEDQCIHRGKFSVEKEMITIKLVDADTDVHYRVRMTSNLKELKKLHSFQMGFGASMSWMFDGKRLFDDGKIQTPISLEMEKDDVIEVYVEQGGS